MIKVNEIKISYQSRIKINDAFQIKSSQDAFKILFDTWDKDTIELYESFKVVLLNNSNKVKGIYNLSSGGITGTMVDIRLLFATALKTLSTAIIIAHNHPSDKLKPSSNDINLTNKIKKASELLDIKLLDHLIICPNKKYFSFSDENLF